MRDLLYCVLPSLFNDILYHLVSTTSVFIDIQLCALSKIISNEQVFIFLSLSMSVID